MLHTSLSVLARRTGEQMTSFAAASVSKLEARLTAPLSQFVGLVAFTLIGEYNSLHGFGNTER